MKTGILNCSVVSRFKNYAPNPSGRVARPSLSSPARQRLGALLRKAPPAAHIRAKFKYATSVGMSDKGFHSRKNVGNPLGTHAKFLRGHGRRSSRERLITRTSPSDMMSLGNDVLVFLSATVFVIPVCKRFNLSPILGFLFSGVALDQLGAFRDELLLEQLSELGVLFLLFEMGLELSLDRLKALAKFAFVLGTLQVAITTGAFTAFELPVGNGLGSDFLEWAFGSSPELVDIRSFDEAVVIGMALSLSSSAFVLQLLSEKGLMGSKFASATLGILLLQDIAVVPMLVLLPLVSAPDTLAVDGGEVGGASLMVSLLPTLLKAIGGLGVLIIGGRTLLRKVFEVVAESRSSTAFVAMCLLTVVGMGIITEELGLSSTLGAFLAGVLLAETNFRTQVEADIQPFRGLLLALFFVTTGTSIDVQLLMQEWPSVFALLGGLIVIKTSIIAACGPLVGLTRAESLRTGLLLSQGGEFAFVLFSLANDLEVLPEELNRLLIIVVVLSMALTPALEEFGSVAAKWIGRIESETDIKSHDEIKGTKPLSAAVEDMSIVSGAETVPIVICGFGQSGQMVASLLGSPMLPGGKRKFIAFDLDHKRARAAQAKSFPVYFGDGSKKEVLHAAGIDHPEVVIVAYNSRERTVEAVRRLKSSFGNEVRVYCRARDVMHVNELNQEGATKCVPENSMAALSLASTVLKDMGVETAEVEYVSSVLSSNVLARATLSDIPESKFDRDLYIYAPTTDTVVMGYDQNEGDIKSDAESDDEDMQECDADIMDECVWLEAEDDLEDNSSSVTKSGSEPNSKSVYTK